MVRAKFYCTEKKIVSQSDDGTFEVTLFPVIIGSEENKEFYKYTPGGSIQLAILSRPAAQQFEPGQCYYVDFTKADS